MTKDGQQTSFIYDTGGQRLLRKDPTSVTLYLGKQELKLDRASNTVSATRYYTAGGGGPTIAARQGATLKWLASDHQATNEVAVNSATLDVTRRRQYPFGAPRDPQPVSWPGDRGFVGGTRDASTGLTHLGAREYDPTLGRFLSVDPIMDVADPQQMNGYTYSNNNPATFSDPTGLCAKDGGILVGCGAVADRSAREQEVAQEWQRRPAPQTRIKRTYGVVKVHAPNWSTYNRAYQAAVRDWIGKFGEFDPHGLECQDILQPLGPNDMCGAALVQNASEFGRLMCEQKGMQCGDYSHASIAGDVLGQGISEGIFLPLGAGATRSGKRAPKGACSFSGDTKVLMADGTSKPIQDIRIGDQIEATDPETGETDTRTVAAVWHHPDTVLELKTDNGATVTTTEDHPFWNVTDHQWQQAQQLDPGDQLYTTNTHPLRVTGLKPTTAHTATAYNVTVAGIHAYYVLAGDASVLVHNGGPGCGANWMSPDKLPHHYMKTSDQGLMHAEDFGVKGSYNKANGQAFVGAVEQFVKNPGTWQIRGTFRGQDAIHYVDDTGLHASFAASGPNVGEYLGGWRSSGDQLTYLLRDGKL